MNGILEKILDGFELSGDLYKDSYNMLIHNNRRIVAEHSREVVKECSMLAEIFGVDSKTVETAGFLHDISAVFPNDRRVEAAEALEIDILEEERQFPLILHQKISRVMAEEIWDIKDNDILNAISCHTTLWDKPSRIDLILFVADKIRWDQRGEPPYIEKVQSGLKISLEHGAWEYIKYLLENKENLRVVHPWLMDAYRFLTNWITREENKV